MGYSLDGVSVGNLVLVATLAVGFATSAQGQTATSTAKSAATADQGLPEIIVTAQRKEERLQDVPISVNVVSGDALATRGVTMTTDLPALIPGLTFGSQGPANVPFLRGIGSNSGNPNDEPSVATYVDGVYIAASDGNALTLANVARIEVLKGPQGTLFGRNATGGVVQIITRDPQHAPALEATAGYGRFGTSLGSIYATTGLTDTLAVDIAAQGSDQSKGWGFNAITNSETYKTKTYSVRSKLLFTPSDIFKATLAADYQYNSSNFIDYRMPPGVLAVDGQPPPAGLYDTRDSVTFLGNSAPVATVRQYGVSLHMNYQTSVGEFVSITSYRHDKALYHPEADATPLPVVEGDLPRLQEDYTQEFQLLSPKGSKIDWTVGLFYYKNKAGYDDITFSGLAFGNPPFSGIGLFKQTSFQHIRSTSAYAQGTVPVAESTKLTVGLRYTDEKQHSETSVFGNPLPNSSTSFGKMTWRLALDHAYTDDVHTYLSYNRGIKAGGFDLLPPGLGQKPFFPETLDAYEVGLKSQLFNRSLRFNAALFDYEYKNIQVQTVASGTAGVVSTFNAAKARVTGLDVDFEAALAKGFTLSGGFTALFQAKYLTFKDNAVFGASPVVPLPAGFCQASSPPGTCLIDASGHPLIRTPKFSGNLTGTYEIASTVGAFPLSLTVTHSNSYPYEAANRLRQDSYTLLNASLGWTSNDGRYGITLWGNNLSNKYYLQSGVSTALGDLTIPAPPRTYGINFKVKLGNQ
jgi:iron complex outermembrane recepter protein